MPTPTDDRDKLLLSKYLIEALSKERQLEVALQAQIAMAQKPQIQLALEEHLAVTRAQIEALDARITELRPTNGLSWVAPIEAAVSVAATVLNQALALGKGPLQLLRGTSVLDHELRNVRDCFWNEAEEIAHYQVIETIAAEMGDKETLELAIAHRLQEEEMQGTLEAFIAELAHDLYETEGSGQAIRRDAKAAA